jgi:DnaJ-class molecular chaperone
MTYYDILGININVTEEDVRHAYRKLAFQNHPDRNPGDNSAANKFKEITEAYEVLIDPETRKKYDFKLPKKKIKPVSKKVEPKNDLVFFSQLPKFDIWGNLLSKKEQEEWLENNRMSIKDIYKQKEWNGIFIDDSVPSIR